MQLQGNKMSEEINYDRRRFLGAMVLSVAAGRLLLGQRRLRLGDFHLGFIESTAAADIPIRTVSSPRYSARAPGEEVRHQLDLQRRPAWGPRTPSEDSFCASRIS
jgi:hypothetical protein